MLIYEYENGKVQIFWDKEANCPLIKSEGFMRLDEVQLTMNKLLAIAVEKGATKYISDFRRLGVFGQEITDWLMQDYYPNLVKSGVRYIANIAPQSALTRIGFNNVTQFAAKMGVERRVFPSLEEAREWLKTL